MYVKIGTINVQIFVNFIQPNQSDIDVKDKNVVLFQFNFGSSSFSSTTTCLFPIDQKSHPTRTPPDVSLHLYYGAEISLHQTCFEIVRLTWVRNRLKRIISAKGWFKLLQIVSKLNTGQRASENISP